MPAVYVLKLTRVGNSNRVTVPRPACTGLGWKVGDYLNLSVGQDKITISKARSPTQVAPRAAPPTPREIMKEKPKEDAVYYVFPPRAWRKKKLPAVSDNVQVVKKSGGVQAAVSNA